MTNPSMLLISLFGGTVLGTNCGSWTRNAIFSLSFQDESSISSSWDDNWHYSQSFEEPFWWKHFQLRIPKTINPSREKKKLNILVRQNGNIKTMKYIVPNIIHSVYNIIGRKPLRTCGGSFSGGSFCSSYCSIGEMFGVPRSRSWERGDYSTHIPISSWRLDIDISMPRGFNWSDPWTRHHPQSFLQSSKPSIHGYLDLFLLDLGKKDN